MTTDRDLFAMNVLIVNKLYHPWIGGVETVVRQSAEYLYSKDVAVKVLVCQPVGRRSRDMVNGVPVIRAGSFGMISGMPLSFDFFRCFFTESKKTDVIVVHHPFPLVDLAIFLFRPKARIIMHYHSDVVRQKIAKFFLRPIFNFTLALVEKIIVSSENLLSGSVALALYKHKCFVIPFSIELPEVEGTLSQELQDTIIQKYGNYILFVGRFSYYKGVEYLIRALERSSVRLICIGDGPLKNHAKALARRLGLFDRITFLPAQQRPELLNYMAASLICVLPSIHRSEAFGIVLAEALACGTPVISTELGTGTSVVNQNNRTGIVVSPRNVDELAMAIATLVNDKDLRRTYGMQGREWIRHMYSYEKNMSELMEVYKTEL